MRLSLLTGLLLAAGVAKAVTPVAQLPFVANQGQWEKQVKYAVAIPGGQLYLENNCFTYHLYASAPHGPEAAETHQPAASHAFRVTMVGAAAAPALAGEEKQEAWHNYFLGNDPARWAAQVPLFAGVRYRRAYPGVDVRWHQQAGGQLEYDFELEAGAQPAAIRLRYEGLDGLAVTPEGNLQLRTSVGDVREQAPVAWQLSATGQRRAVPCRFVLHGQEVSFALGPGYNPAERLVIDPVLVFSTYSGSPGGMSANTAISDAQGNMYTGGYVLGDRYPVTLGAIKSTYRYGNIGISKLAATGSSLLYATYLGGNNGSVDDYPLDFEINTAGELLILGATISADYPTTAGAYDRTLGNGSSGGFSSRDLVITRFNAMGTVLLASTFLGGSSEEAGGTSTVPASLAVDPAGDILVVSSTNSVNYPVLNAQQNTYGGGSGDGVLTRLNATLTDLRWSTYLGGTGTDRLLDVKVAPSGDVYVCGSTLSTNLPVGTGGINPLPLTSTNFTSDGFVVRYSAAGARLSGTFLGTSSADVARFLDFDAAGNVLVGGVSEGPYLRTPGVFSAIVANTTGLFVHALSPALNTTVFATQISVLGAGGLGGSNVLTGFGRDACGRLYFSSYAGALNAPGCPRTADAFSSQPRSLYLAVLSEGATALLYGTYIGESNSNPFSPSNTHLHFAASNQVTRSGMLYHIICGIGRGFGTTTGAYSAGVATQSSNDGAAFKFNLAPTATGPTQLAIARSAAGCAPYTLQFVNNSAGGIQYTWDFGDGSPTDTARAPRHTYATAGTYTARVVGTPRPGVPTCGSTSASLNIPVVVVAPASIRTVTDSLTCGNVAVLDPTQFIPSGGTLAYQWSTGEQTPTLAVTAPGRYSVEINRGEPCPLVVEYTVKLSQLFDLPNVLTVNGDGLNATLKIPASYGTPELKIFNRWGRLVYETSAYRGDWTGAAQPAGVYFYHLRQPACDVNTKGWVEIIR